MAERKNAVFLCEVMDMNTGKVQLTTIYRSIQFSVWRPGLTLSNQWNKYFADIPFLNKSKKKHYHPSANWHSLAIIFVCLKPVLSTINNNNICKFKFRKKIKEI